jgi:hypothetical protein
MGNNNLKGFERFAPLVVILVVMILVFSAYYGAYAASNNNTVLRSLTNTSSLEVLLVPVSNVSREEMHFRVGFLIPRNYSDM